MNSLVNVSGGLTLAGVLNVTNGGSFGAGSYRLLNYGGDLTNSGLTLGVLPAGFVETVSTAVAGQVNLVVSSSTALTQLWDGPETTADGTLHGGSGTWDNFTTNFTDAAASQNAAWQNGVAVFAANPGTVTLGDNIAFQGIQFESDGYTIVGAGSFALNPLGTATISTDPGVSATISAPINGAGGLDKEGLGTLVLSGMNAYGGGTTVGAGILGVAVDSNLGAMSGGIVLAGGELLTTVDGFNSGRTVDVATAGGTLAAASGTTSTYAGIFSDIGGLTVGDGVNAGRVVLSGTNSYSGGTNLNGGILAVASDGNLGTGGLTFNSGTLEALTVGGGITSAKTVLLNGGGGTFLSDPGTVSTLSATISGVGSLTKTGTGSLFITGTGTYSGGTVITGGALVIGNGGPTGSIVGNVLNNGVLSFERSNQVTFAGNISGTGAFIQNGLGTTILSGTSSYTGATTVAAGSVQVDGVLGSTAVTVQSAATLSGQGIIGGPVTIQDGAHLAPGPGAQTLGVGDLTLSSGSILDYVLSTPGVIGSGVNSLVSVTGNLTLAGTLNVTNGGNFGAGAYRLFNYTGDLSGSTLTLGTLPAGFTETVTTGVVGQVNLVVSASAGAAQFWDGANTTFDGTVHGGSGTWNNFTTNFTDAGVTVNQSWQNGVAIFSAGPGTVILGDNIAFQGLQFTVDGYTIAGGVGFELDPTGIALITTDAGVGAMISAPIDGSGGINKAGDGLLTLSGDNSYAGGTTVSGGTLSVGDDTNLGLAGVGLVLNGGELQTSADFSSGRKVTLVPSVNGLNELEAATATTATYTGVISGSGGLLIGAFDQTGTVVLTAVNTYTDGTTISGGVLSVGSDENLGDGSGGITLDEGELLTSASLTTFRPIALTVNGGTLAAATGQTADFQGNITGPGSLSVGDGVNAGTVEFSGANTYTGPTTVQNGVTLQAKSVGAFSAGSAFVILGNLDLNGFSSQIGSLAGNGTVTNGAPFSRAVLTTGADNSDSTFSGVLRNGAPGALLFLTKAGSGTLVLTGANTYTGGTIITGGNLQLGNFLTPGSIVGAVVNSASFDLVNTDSSGLTSVTTNASSETSLLNNSTVGTATVVTNTGGTFDISQLTTAGVTIDSIAGGGNYRLGSKALTLGADGSDSVVSGSLLDGGGAGGVGGSLIKVGGGTLTLTGANTYTGGTTISGGIVQLGTGGATGSLIGPVIDNSSLIVDRSATLVLAGPISGLGSVTQAGPGTVILPGTNSYSGATNVTAGTLQVDGLLTQSAVTVFSGATLSGQGTIAQDVTVENGGTLAPGPGAQTLTVGNLTLNQNSILDYSLSTPGVVGLGVNFLVDVNGNLTLDGILNVGNGGSFGAGAYRLLNYTGVLDDETLQLGILPAGFTGSVTTGVGGQVNLVVSSTASVSQFWDGTNTVFDGVVHGGDGVWDNSATNFTDGAVTVNQAWQNGVAIFSAAAGTVTLGTDIAFQGLQFTISGYAIVGSGAFTLVPTGTALISTDSGVTATVTAPVTGTGGIDKTGGGELVLAGVNTYTGGTIVSGGILSIAADGNLGNAAGGVELNGGELLTSANLTSARTVTLAASLNGPNTVAAAANTVGTYTGLFVGSGGLTVGDPVNVGTVVLENLNNSYTGGTTVAGGIVSVGLDGDLGEVSGGIHLNAGEVLTTGNGFLSFRPVDLMIGGGILAASAGGVGDLQGNITGSGTLNVGDALNTGTVEFSGTNTYTGSTTIGGARR